VIGEYEQYVFPSVPVIPGAPPIDNPVEDWLDGLAEAYIDDPAIAHRLMWGVSRALNLAVDAGALEVHPLANTTFIDLERYTAEQVKAGYL
jgi:hypothetical protein